MTTKTLNYEERQKEEADQLQRNRNRLDTVALGLTFLEPFKGFRIVKPDERYDVCVDLEAKDGRLIHLYVGRREKPARLRVTGRYPHDSKGRYVQVRNAPEVSVALDRAVDDIGKDIARRFLPDYQARFNDVAAQVKTQNEQHVKLVAVGKRLAARLQARFDETRVDHEVHISEYRPDRIAVKTYDGERFSLEIDVKSEGDLNKILDVLNPHKDDA